MHEEMLRQVVGLEYQALALVGAPLTTLAVGWLLRMLAVRLRDRHITAEASRLVSWAMQAIPDKSLRYGEVAAVLSRRFPMLSGEQIEVLIESEVLGLKTALRGAGIGAPVTVTTTESGAVAAPHARDAARIAAAPAAPTAPTPSAIVAADGAGTSGVPETSALRVGV